MDQYRQELEEEIKRERDEYYSFTAENPFPSKEEVFSWMSKACQSGDLNNAFGQPFFQALGYGINDIPKVDYDALKRLYELGPKDEFKEGIKQIGQCLNDAGGKHRMSLHYYILQAIVGGGQLIPGDRPNGAIAYNKYIEHCWDGIGTWQA